MCKTNAPDVGACAVMGMGVGYGLAAVAIE